MLVLNLIEQSKGDITFDVVSFSDTQTLINLTGRFANGPSNNDVVQIRSRMSWSDLQLIACANQSLREAGFKYIHLFVPYFLGARSDRKFQDGSINYLKAIICPFVNAQKFDTVTVVDPHSNCLEMGLDRFRKLTNHQIVEFALADLAQKNVVQEKLCWLVPDKGANDKAYETIKQIGFKGHIIECSKKRDKLTGKIVETNIPSDIIFEGDPCLIVDDICDGGYTFTELAKKAKERGAGDIYLVVTHGIFSRGVAELLPLIQSIYCTNSVKDFPPSFFMKQLNIL